MNQKILHHLDRAWKALHKARRYNLIHAPHLSGKIGTAMRHIARAEGYANAGWVNTIDSTPITSAQELVAGIFGEIASTGLIRTAREHLTYIFTIPSSPEIRQEVQAALDLLQVEEPSQPVTPAAHAVGQTPAPHSTDPSPTAQQPAPGSPPAHPGSAATAAERFRCPCCGACLELSATPAT